MKSLLRLLPMVVVIAALTQITSPYLLNLASVIAIQALPALGLTLLLGYAGQISLGQAGFYALGAYGSALLALHLNLNPWGATALATAATGLLAYLLGRPILRLRGHFLAMATLGFGSIVFVVLTQWRGLTGGSIGLSGIPPYRLLGTPLTTTSYFAPLAWTILLVVVVLLSNLITSPIGLLLCGLGDSERAVGSLGTDVGQLKTRVFALSAMLAAAGGGLYAHYIGFLSPQPFDTGFSIQLLIMVALGGFRSFGGTILGVAIAILIAEPLQDLGSYDVVSFGLLLVLTIVLCPEGLLVTASQRLTTMLRWRRAAQRAAP